MPKDMTTEKKHFRQGAYSFEILVEPKLGYKVKCMAFRETTVSYGMWFCMGAKLGL
jgi:hypothetical protein